MSGISSGREGWHFVNWKLDWEMTFVVRDDILDWVMGGSGGLLHRVMGGSGGMLDLVVGGSGGILD